ncbi:biosynthetic-type acetolactate synthase large subunit [Caproiciproducens galactitolivorans]|uniref:Acetolactate synthase n=1 Tax=Caproiciproducens galactitolivorans TaxID=642589 RepID=A0A4Z0Y0Q4_9FIRM|nr:biosynthetic-type acetolactate synthase large subunit [Caproiciproducens galactitolivorans]QEY35596.1 biosynthetic-type acetolactate synthase large subunit [Caproiciproducens galactitolivorans]TGJ77324.1 acetolactate synthase large subunit [Caproiciproducens galactitolivorans]
MQLTGAQILMECLLEQGVDTVFGYPGGAVLNIYDALYEYRDKICHIRTAHEQGAAHAADGYARSTGKTGVCIATSGPGATNLVTGIATAYMDSIPMVAITGNVSCALLGLDSFQEVDITGITMPVTKHNFLVKHIEDLADTIRKAFLIAGTGRKGPVLVDIPKDVTAQKYEYIPHAPLPAPKGDFPYDERFEQALTMLKKSERPFIYSGGGVIASEASGELKKFADLLDAPVASSLMCQGGFDQTDPRYIGMLGMHGTNTSALAIKNCDLLIAIGTRFSDRVLCNADLFAQHCPIIQIDIDTAEFNKNIEVDLKMKGDAKEILARLNQLLPQCQHKGWLEQIAEWKDLYPLEQMAESEGEVLPQEVIETLDRLTDSKAIIVTEVGQHQMWAAQFYRFRTPRHFISSGGLGTMGYGLGAAIGAQVANPDQRVINLAGDGSFHMNCNELATLAQYNIPVIELVFNNRVLGMVRQWQKLFYQNRFSQTTLDSATNFEMLAQAFGIKAFAISRREEIEPVLKEALAYQGPSLINCHISPDINVLPMVPAGSSVEEPILEM